MPAMCSAAAAVPAAATVAAAAAAVTAAASAAAVVAAAEDDDNENDEPEIVIVTTVAEHNDSLSPHLKLSFAAALCGGRQTSFCSVYLLFMRMKSSAGQAPDYPA